MEKEIKNFLNISAFSLDELKGRSRQRDLAYHRFVAMYLLRNKGYGFENIARFFNRDHSVVIHACRQVEAAIDGYNKQLFNIYKLAVHVEDENRVLCNTMRWNLKPLKIRQ